MTFGYPTSGMVFRSKGQGQRVTKWKNISKVIKQPAEFARLSSAHPLVTLYLQRVLHESTWSGICLNDYETKIKTRKTTAVNYDQTCALRSWAEIAPSRGRMIGIDRWCRNKCRTECGVAARDAVAVSATGADVAGITVTVASSQYVTTGSWQIIIIANNVYYYGPP